MITVGGLIQLLRQFDEDKVVILQKDSEGNGYSPLSGLQPLYYEYENTWSGEVNDEDGLPCVVLSPVN